MKSWEKLFQKAEALNDEEKFAEALALLTDELLEKYQRAELYAERARAKEGSNNTATMLDDVEKAIKLDPNYFDGYFERGNYRLDKGEYDKAIQDYSEAIKLKPDFAMAFYNRGNAWDEKGEYDKAIQDYNEAIRLEPDDSSAYNNRGNAWDEKGEVEKAIADYLKAIEIEPEDAVPYNNIGIIHFNREEYDKALHFYSRCLALDKNYSFAYNNRALLWEKRGDLQKALNDYDTALEINPNFLKARTNRDLLLIKMNKELGKVGNNEDIAFYLIYKTLWAVEEDLKEEIFRLWVNKVRPCMEAVRQHAIPKEKIEALAHYTNLYVADCLLSNEKAKLRYSNIVFVNDPQEGEVFVNSFEGEDKQNPIGDAFNAGRLGEDSNIYVGSFLPGHNHHKDELLMWRTYGKDEKGQEAAGCCLVLAPEFFDAITGGSLNPELRTSRDRDSNQQPIYQVLYYKNRGDDKGFIGNDPKALQADVDKLKMALRQLLVYKTNNPDNEKLATAINKVIYHTLSELCYFFKSADYQYENEYRVIQFATPGNTELVKIEEGSERRPRRVYIESSRAVLPHVKEIILGPMVPQPRRWMYLDVYLTRYAKNLGKTPARMIFSECKIQQ